MAYLNEDGLETLVGKIKGQVIELTSAEYRQLPATKNSDNKLYFVNDEAYAYQIDDEPTSGSSGLVKSGGVYNWTSKIGSGTLTTTAQTLIPAVNEVNSAISSVASSVSTVDTGLRNIIIYRNVSVSVTVPGNGVIYDQTIAAPTVSGYKPFAIGGWRFTGGGYADTPFTRLNLNETNGNIEYAMMTRNSSQVVLTGIIKVLYIRSDWVNVG